MEERGANCSTSNEASTATSNKKEYFSWFSQFRNASNPWMARYVYGLIFLVANLLAWAARDYGSGALTEMQSKIAQLLRCLTFTSYHHNTYSLLLLLEYAIINLHTQSAILTLCRSCVSMDQIMQLTLRI